MFAFGDGSIRLVGYSANALIPNLSPPTSIIEALATRAGLEVVPADGY
jgi:hypothetical protein